MSEIDLRNEVPEAESAGCGSCLGSCSGTILAFMALSIFCQRMGDQHTGLQVLVAYLLGMTLGKLTSHFCQREFSRPITAKVGLLVTGLPILVFSIGGLIEGITKYQEVMDRSAPGWGRADIANYSYPVLWDYLSSVLFLVLALGWLGPALGAYRRQRRGDRL